MNLRLSASALLLLAACSNTTDPAHKGAGLSEVRAEIAAHNYGTAAEHARKLAQRMQANADVQFELARAEALLGNQGAAFDALDAAVRAGLPNVAAALADPAFNGIRETERFAAIEARASPAGRRAEHLTAGEGPDQVSITTDAQGRDTVRAGNIILDTDF